MCSSLTSCKCTWSKYSKTSPASLSSQDRKTVLLSVKSMSWKYDQTAVEYCRPVGCKRRMDSGILRVPMPTSASASAMEAWKEPSISEGPSQKPTCVPSRSISRRPMLSRSPFCTWRTVRNRRCNGRPLARPKEYIKSMSTGSAHCVLSWSKLKVSFSGLWLDQPPACFTSMASTCVEQMLSSGSSPISLSTSTRMSGRMTRRSSVGSSNWPSLPRRKTKGFAKPNSSTHQAWSRPMKVVQPAMIISK
mmetsp:Transcript_134723/g.430428  ORF Transcript_134723/g.430428 Transcript_134723/m.430428 type:complete len:248 (-) Transcript_134723:8679-9422(-)